jgi:2,3-bisphosphoglycerate-independent phosphoglycerate mutase
VSTSQAKKTVLIVLDGFGIGKDSVWNAIANARKPFLKSLLEKYPHSELLTHGEAVGLPDGVMGNSEVGHMTMGAGRIIYQDLTRISASIRAGKFFQNSVLKDACKTPGRLHLMGLLSDGGVHSHIEHLEACLDLALREGVQEISLHLFLDGRDTPPNSGVSYLERILLHESLRSGRARIVSLSGRYFAMDRDQRWDRVEKAYRVICGEDETRIMTPLEYLKSSYGKGKTDEFLEPACFLPEWGLKPEDSLLFFNYRSDRAREISEALTAESFSHFNRNTRLSTLTGMTQYDPKLNLKVAFGPQNLDHLFGEVLEEGGLSQLRCAETEKYAHVTFFFNGGREKPFAREDRILIPSPRGVTTYDLKPEMSAPEVAEAVREKILHAEHDFVLLNFANADMVGHTGNYEAAVRAIEALDRCLERVVSAAHSRGRHTLITADHGNAEEMRDCHDHLHTQHTLNPVPAIWVMPNSANVPQSFRTPLNDGTLADLMPTLCEWMQLPTPQEVTGKSLLPRDWRTHAGAS